MKWQERNSEVVKSLKKIYEGRMIFQCEVQTPGICQHFMFLSFHHRHKRRWYKLKQWLLKTFNQTILACGACHEFLEQHPEESRAAFERLRGEENEHGIDGVERFAYVDLENGDDANDGTLEHPFKTTGRAWAECSDGFQSRADGIVIIGHSKNHIYKKA